MSTLFAAQRPLPLVFGILIIVLAIGDYFIPRDYHAATINPAGWIIWSAFLWSAYTAISASQIRVLRSLDMPQQKWQRATHGVILGGSVLFGAIAAAAHYIAQAAGVPVDSSFEVYFDYHQAQPISTVATDDTAAQLDWRLIALTVLGFIVAYLLAGYGGIGIGLIVTALRHRGIVIQAIATVGTILAIVAVSMIARRLIYSAVGYLAAPFPGLFVFGGLGVLVGAALVWKLPVRIHP